MRRRRSTRDPLDRPRGGWLWRAAGWTAGILGVFALGLLFVDGVQPVSYRLAGRVVTSLGGGQAVAVAVVLAVYLAAGAAALACWWQVEHRGLRWSTIVGTAMALPLWLLAFGLGPVSRDPDEGTERVASFVGDADLADALEHGVAVSLAAFVVIVLACVGVRQWWRGDREDLESLQRVEAATRRERQAAERSRASKR